MWAIACDCSWSESGAALYSGVTGPSVVRVSAEGDVADRSECEVVFVSRCLEWPQAVSGVLVSAATFNQPFRLAGLRRGGPQGGRVEATPCDLRSSWRGGDCSPRTMISNYARRFSLSSDQ
jgi:hypothetical protein